MRLPDFLTKQIVIPIWFILSCFFLAYIGWEFYWFGQVGLLFVKWHTHLMVLVIAWFIMAILLGLLTARKEAQYSLGAIMITLIVVEFLHILTGFNTTYIENRSGFYQSIYEQNSNDKLRVYLPNREHHLIKPEFDFKRTSNKFGFSDSEFQFSNNKPLIQTYGDSFTEGDGAPSDSSYPSQLNRLLNQEFTIQNYGICGNDPGFYANQISEIGKIFNPSILVLSYCTLDFTTDVMKRGGMERFTAAGLEYPKGPWWEIIYATSFISRLFFHAFGIHYNSLFMTEGEKLQRYNQLKNKWNGIFIRVAEIAKENNMKVLLIKKPERSEIDQNKYQFDLSFFDSLLVKEPVFHHFDMLPSYRRRMKMDSGGTTAAYFWVEDGHHNPQGYLVMAEIVKEALLQTQLLSEDFKTKNKSQ